MFVSDEVCGTMLVVSAAMTFALVALIVDTGSLPSTAAAEARFFVCWVLSIAYMARYRNERKLQFFGPSGMRWALFLRGCLTCGFVTLWWAALPMAPLGNLIAVIHCAPLLTVICSRIILGEKMLDVFPIQALLAAAGMCLIIQPPWLVAAIDSSQMTKDSGGGDYSLAIMAMIMGALIPIATRSTKSASWIEVEHVTSFVAVFVLNPINYCAQLSVKGEGELVGPHVSMLQLGAIVLAGMGSFFAVAMQTRGYQMADPGKASMFCYLEVPFGYLLQLMCTSDSSISMTSIIGAVLVLLSCLLGAGSRLYSSRKEAEKEVPLLG